MIYTITIQRSPVVVPRNGSQVQLWRKHFEASALLDGEAASQPYLVGGDWNMTFIVIYSGMMMYL